jgi:hypothetical protein
VFSVKWIGASHGKHRDGDAWSGGSRHVVLRNEAMRRGMRPAAESRASRSAVTPSCFAQPNEGVREGLAGFIRALPKVAAERSGLPEG